MQKKHTHHWNECQGSRRKLVLIKIKWSFLNVRARNRPLTLNYNDTILLFRQQIRGVAGINPTMGEWILRKTFVVRQQKGCQNPTRSTKATRGGCLAWLLWSTATNHEDSSEESEFPGLSQRLMICL